MSTTPATQAPPLLELDELRTWFPIKRGLFSRTIGHVKAVDGVSLRIDRGETLGLVGESGCGKTTVARTVVGLERAQSGRIVFDGKDIMRLPERAMMPFRRRMQMVFQDPYASLNPRMSVLDIISEGMLQHRIVARSEREEAATALLREVGMDKGALHRFPHEFSGGQRQRISIARAIALKPELLLCDEAVSALDVSVQAQVINLLCDLRERHGLSYLFISHDLSVVRHISHRVAVMYVGKIVEHGPTRSVIDSPRHPYTRALISAVPRVGGDRGKRIVLSGDVPSPASPPKGCRFHPRCPYAVDACRVTEPELRGPANEPEGRRRVACLRQDEI